MFVKNLILRDRLLSAFAANREKKSFMPWVFPVADLAQAARIDELLLHRSPVSRVIVSSLAHPCVVTNIRPRRRRFVSVFHGN